MPDLPLTPGRPARGLLDRIAGSSRGLATWFLRGSGALPAAGARDGRLRILHLGFEDPAMPGSGGGALRTHEVNRRIAVDHEVTVLTQRFPGCRDRVEDGVRYLHIGVGAGRSRLTRLLGYAAAMVPVTRRIDADLVVEDFFAPVSTLAAPLWSGTATLGVVQWLNAREKTRQYRVPVHLVERWGVRHHREVVSVSAGVAERLRALNPAIAVHVIGNGVSSQAFDATEPGPGRDVVFVGRLEIQQKGLDLLLDAWASLGADAPGRLRIAGSGPDEERLRARCRELGIAGSVEFLGWVDGPAKYALMRSARVVVVPSRFETFGIVALEALAVGRPVVAFDIDCLRDVIPAGCGTLVPPFDVAAFGRALRAAVADERLSAAADDRGRAFARTQDWDAIAQRQRAVYEQVGRGRETRSHPPDGVPAFTLLPSVNDAL